MKAGATRAALPKVVKPYAWVAGFLLIRTHYFLTIIVGPVFGWR